MSEHLPVLVAMDNVIADLDGEVMAQIRIRLPEVSFHAPRTHFRISDDYPTHSEAISELWREHGFFASLQVIEHAHLGWERMRRLGFYPRICSAPISSNPFCKDEKLAWLDQHWAPVFGRQVVDEAIIASHKYRYDGIALIDAKPNLDEEREASWQHIVFNQPYNRDVHKPQLYGWLAKDLGELLGRAEILYRPLGRNAIQQT